MQNLMPRNKNVIYAIGAVVAVGIAAAAFFFWPGKDDASPEAASQETAAKKTEQEALATVNGKKITVADLAMAEEEVSAQLSNVPPERQVGVLLNYLIERELVAQDGRKKGMELNNDVQRRVAYYTNKSIRDVHLAELIKSRISEDEVRAFYDDEVKKFVPQEEVHARHILVTSKAEAEQALAKVNSGTSFEDVAREMSQDTGSKQSGGDLGYFIKRGMFEPAFADAAFALKPGEISKPVESPAGWHVIKFEDKRMQITPPFEAVRDGLYGELMQREGRTVMQELRDKAEVSILVPTNKDGAQAGSALAPTPSQSPEAGAAQ